MKLGRFACVLVVSCSLCFAQKLDRFSDCQKKAQSQRDLQVCADHQFTQGEAAMQRTYQRLLAKAKSDPVAENKIRAAQRSWLAFRDAQLEAMYPHEDKQGEYGSTYPMCALLQKTELTRQRTQMLSKMLTPVEGDTCDSGLRYSSGAEQSTWPKQRCPFRSAGAE